MVCKYQISKNLDRILLKLGRKNKKLFEQVLNKIGEVINSSNVEHYKNLRHSLKEYKRVHVGNSFVLIFRHDKRRYIIYFDDFDHHDKIYR